MAVGAHQLSVYVAAHCDSCRYALEVADGIRQRYPEVRVRVVDIESQPDAIPEAVFATPTYLLNGQVWSLGNPSEEKIREAFG